MHIIRTNKPKNKWKQITKMEYKKKQIKMMNIFPNILSIFSTFSIYLANILTKLEKFNIKSLDHTTTKIKYRPIAIHGGNKIRLILDIIKNGIITKNKP